MGHIGFEPTTSALSRQRSKPTELMTQIDNKGRTYLMLWKHISFSIDYLLLFKLFLSKIYQNRKRELSKSPLYLTFRELNHCK